MSGSTANRSRPFWARSATGSSSGATSPAPTVRARWRWSPARPPRPRRSGLARRRHPSLRAHPRPSRARARQHAHRIHRSGRGLHRPEARGEHRVRSRAIFRRRSSRRRTCQRALRETLEAALRIECLEWGCVFLFDRSTGAQDLVHQRGVSPAQVAVLAGAQPRRDRRTRWRTSPGLAPVVEVVPIMHRGEPSSPGWSPAERPARSCRACLKAGLRSLGVLAGNAVSRIIAEQSRGDAVADLEAFIAIAPVPTWVLDARGPRDHVEQGGREGLRLAGRRGGAATCRRSRRALPTPADPARCARTAGRSSRCDWSAPRSATWSAMRSTLPGHGRDLRGRRAELASPTITVARPKLECIAVRRRPRRQERADRRRRRTVGRGAGATSSPALGYFDSRHAVRPRSGRRPRSAAAESSTSLRRSRWSA